VSLRLNSLAVKAANTPRGTQVNYLRQGEHLQANARHTIMAGWHMMGAHIITDLPPRQKAAMRANIKMPMVYVQVALRQWQPLQRSGVAAAYCPGAYFQFVQMDFPVRMGAYQPAHTPDAPTTLLLIRMPCPLLAAGTPEDLLRQGRAELLGTPFETYEEQVRAQLGAMYGPYGFDGARDIAAITVNRWPHGFVYEDALFDGEPAHLLARKRHGRIAMANADSAGSAYTNAAIDMAWRAVQELSG
jgi:spermidine dehydrogenase